MDCGYCYAISTLPYTIHQPTDVSQFLTPLCFANMDKRTYYMFSGETGQHLSISSGTVSIKLELNVYLICTPT